ncbi:MAG TPA: cupredoxin domain-containing protein [Gaiellaceae bacterium]|jgi:plastocyanin|nr:cupredoxin domain-containing protein [Gaiellaceae bacterium]
MKKALLLAASVLALVVGATALAAVTVTRTVAIRSTGFVPVTRTIQTGDSIRWRNDDTVNHQVVADNGLFASPVLRPRATYTKLFTTSGTYRYRDALKPSSRGTIVVQGPPPSVSIAASAGVVFWGASVRLAGTISSGAANQTVQVWARPYGQTSFVKQADVATAPGGAWDFPNTPQVLTEYYAKWGNRTSATASVGVRPRLTFIRRAPWFVTSVKAGGTSFAGHYVYVQRKSSLGQWVNIKKVVMGSSGARRFKVKLNRGRHALRIFLTTNQAGPGYLWSNSQTIVFRKRTK